MRLSAISVVLPVLAVLLGGCQTTGTSAEAESARTPVPLTAETQELLLGFWEGRWEADNGSSNAFSLDITEIRDNGEVHGSRGYVTASGSSARPTVGEIREGRLLLDTEKGPKSWIDLALHQDPASGELWLEGRYSAQGGDEVYLGDISARKWKDL